MNKTLIKPAALIMAGAVLMYSMNTFAATTVQSNVSNAVQTIQRTIFTSDGTPNGITLVDVNTGSRIYINSGAAPYASGTHLLGLDDTQKVVRMSNMQIQECSNDPMIQLSCDLGLDDCPSICYLASNGSNNGTGADHDWYEIGTTTSPNNINDNKYTLGKVSI